MSKSSSKNGMKFFLFLILAAIAAIALIFFCKAKSEIESDEMFTMPSNAERVEFLNKQGLIVAPDPISKEEAAIPSEFEGVYADYAELQKSQGFDLESHKGETASIITYKVMNYPGNPDNVTATMLLLDGRLIGGDITVASDDGQNEVKPLISAAAQTLLQAN